MKSLHIIVPCALMIACGLVDLGHSHPTPGVADKVMKSLGRNAKGGFSDTKAANVKVNMDKSPKIGQTSGYFKSLAGNDEKQPLKMEQAQKDTTIPPSWLLSGMVEQIQNTIRYLNPVEDPEAKAALNKKLESVGPILADHFSEGVDSYTNVLNRIWKELRPMTDEEILQVRRDMAKNGWVAPENMHLLENIDDENPETKKLSDTKAVNVKVNSGPNQHLASQISEGVDIDKSPKVVQTSGDFKSLAGNDEKQPLKMEQAQKDTTIPPSWLLSGMVEQIQNTIRYLNPVEDPEAKAALNKKLESVGPILADHFSEGVDSYTDVLNRIWKELRPMTDKEILQVRRDMAKSGWVAPENMHLLEPTKGVSSKI